MSFTALPGAVYGAPDRITLLASGYDVSSFAAQLKAHPELWDQITGRTAPADSPHHAIHDIWCRFAPPGTSGAEPHHSVWYPAADYLPVRNIARQIMAFVGGTELGGVLITRIPPGKQVLPHVDPGWHARHYEKFALQVQAAPGQRFHFFDQSLETKTGDLYWFRNEETHWVINESDEDRITAIFCVRVE